MRYPDLVLLLMTLMVNQLFGQTTHGTNDRAMLFHQIMTVDSIFFQALNSCDLALYESLLTEDFEFYHDLGGLTKSREKEMKSMAVSCGDQRQRQKLRRELIKESVEVNPINNFGAVETGRHRFYLVIDDQHEKVIEEAKFINVWENQPTSWKLSRVISYDHQPVSTVQLTDRVLDLYAGQYQMSPDRIIVVTRDARLLRVQDGDWSAYLYPESNSRFYLDYGNVQFEFVKGQTEQVDKIVIYENGHQIEEGIKKN